LRSRAIAQIEVAATRILHRAESGRDDDHHETGPRITSTGSLPMTREPWAAMMPNSWTCVGNEGLRFAVDSPVEEDGFEPVWGFSCQVVIFGLLAVLCSERESRSSFFNRAPGPLQRARARGSSPSCSLPGQAAPTEPPGNITSPGGPVLKVAKGPVLDVG
jgi:hypothetical protein